MSDVDFEAHTTYFARVAKEAKIARLQIHDELSQRLQQAVAPKPKPPDPKAPPGLPGPPPALPIPPGFCLPEGTRRGLKRAKEQKTGAFMTVKPLDATGYHLSKYEWLDNVAVRYNKPLIEAPAR
jgi:hypothetical protein